MSKLRPWLALYLWMDAERQDELIKLNNIDLEGVKYSDTFPEPKPKMPTAKVVPISTKWDTETH